MSSKFFIGLFVFGTVFATASHVLVSNNLTDQKFLLIVDTYVDRSMAIASQFYKESSAKVSAVLGEKRKNLFEYQSVEFAGNYRLTERFLQESFVAVADGEVWNGRPSVVREAFVENPWIKNTEVELGIFPSRILVTIEEIEPWIVAELNGHSWVVSTDGNLVSALSEVRDPDQIIELSKLPRLVGLNPHEENAASASERFKVAVELIKVLEMSGEFPFEYDQIELLSNGGLKLLPRMHRSFPAVLFNANGLADSQQRLERLRLVMADLEKRGERADEIDLRFNPQAVVR